MSYSIQPYLIDAQALSSALGSKDAALLQAVISNHSDQSGDGSDGNCISLHAALTHLIMGEVRDKKSAHQYGYALELMCRQLGMRGESWDGGYRGAFVKSGLDKLIMKSGPPVPLPPNNDFPVIGHITREGTGKVLKKVQDLMASSPDDDLQVLLNDVEEWVEEADLQKKTLVFFNY